jgi:GAF domain-containing protein
MSFRRSETDIARLWTLWTRELLDSQPEAECEELTQLAASLCGTPTGLITLLDERHQWVRASDSFKLGETPREIAFCAHAVRQQGLFVVKDALLDNRFGTNPLVTSDPPLRFYAGTPMLTDDGNILGTFSVLDVTPRVLSAEQANALEVLACPGSCTPASSMPRPRK